VLPQIFAGFALSLLIGITAYWRGSLTRSGVLGAVLTGTAIFGFGGIVPGFLLVAFFVSSSALSQFRARAKEPLAEKFQKGSRRDFGQALANGGWAAVLAIAFGLTFNEIFFIAFIGAIATVTADTWATEIGVLSSRPPRLITTGKSVPVGTSGGITLLGTLTALAGGIFIGVIATAAFNLILLILPIGFPEGPNIPTLFNLILFPFLAGASGLTGSLFDSLLGATVQAIYFCDYDQKETERRLHSCGRETRRIRGWTWLDNDAVNFLASIFGSGVATLLWYLLSL
jgi:uncharacterized protein (TIGR00297 family)